MDDVEEVLEYFSSKDEIVLANGCPFHSSNKENTFGLSGGLFIIRDKNKFHEQF